MFEKALERSGVSILSGRKTGERNKGACLSIGQHGTSSNQLCNGGLPAHSPPFGQHSRRWWAILENIAAQLLADGDMALRGLHEGQRGGNIHRRQRLQFLINNLATLLVRVGHAVVVTGAGLQAERLNWVKTGSAFDSRIQTGQSLTRALRTSTPSLKKHNLCFLR